MFRDSRSRAGEELSHLLEDYKKAKKTIVLGIPPGGVIVAHAIAKKLELPFDVIVTSVITYEEEETGKTVEIGAAAEDGYAYVDPLKIDQYDIHEDMLRELAEESSINIEKRVDEYREGRSLPPLENRTVILVTDRMANGYAPLAALQIIEQQNPAKIIIATPIILSDVAQELNAAFSEVYALKTPETEEEMKEFFKDFRKIDDEDAIELIKQ